ncbi:MAG TPA: hypothetical protein VED46_03210 [Alphaproteobacteria bacterium]|nr:hypothetical protein [Alphaproteobacteria bacterium]
MPLAFLAAEIVEAVLAGTQPVDLTAETLTRRADMPLNWAEQKASVGFLRLNSSAANRTVAPGRRENTRQRRLIHRCSDVSGSV